MRIKRGFNNWFVLLSAPEYRVDEYDEMLPKFIEYIERFDTGITVARIMFADSVVREIRKSSTGAWFKREDKIPSHKMNRMHRNDADTVIYSDKAY